MNYGYKSAYKSFAANVVVVTVSYGDRAVYLTQVVPRLIDIGIHKIIIVNNNMTESSRMLLNNLYAAYSNDIEILHMSANSGSAKAFKAGLLMARQSVEQELILMLDDDNLPEKNLLEVLSCYWSKLKPDHYMFALTCNRVMFGVNERIITEDAPWLLLGKPNSFLGLHINDFAKRICAKVFHKAKSRQEHLPCRYANAHFAPYGGLFFHKNILDRIGYPNEDYIIYADDCEFSYRITSNGGSLYAVLDAKIYDLDNRSDLTNYGNVYNLYANYYNRVRLYYTLRNAVHFHFNYHCTSKPVFFLNLIFYYLLCCFYVSLKGNFFRLTVFRDSFIDGVSGKLGESKSYQLSDLDTKARNVREAI